MAKRRPSLKGVLPSLIKISQIELDEILNNIREKGPEYTRLVKILIEEEVVYTNKGRLNKSALSRMMRMKPKELEDLFYNCQKEFSK